MNTVVTLPAIYSYAKQEFIYSALRLIVTPHADPKLVAVAVEALKTYRRV